MTRVRLHVAIASAMFIAKCRSFHVAVSFIQQPRRCSLLRSPSSKRRQTPTIRKLSDDEGSIDSFNASEKNPSASQPSQALVESLLGSAMGRAMRTLSTRATDSSPPRSSEIFVHDDRESVNENVIGVISSASRRASRTLESKTSSESESSTNQNGRYLKNPSITSTALAHVLWSHVVRTNDDICIDATCGNGHDSVAIAKMLFDETLDPKPENDERPRLVCIDIQQQACENTRQALSKVLDMDTLEKHVQILQTSHSPLPPVGQLFGLVCFNLGYLPSADKDMVTNMESTIQSMTDAALQLRVGGMISCMTYPRTNANEDYAVHALMEGLALISSSTEDALETHVQELGPDIDDAQNECYSVREAVQKAMDRIKQEGDKQQTWRVMEHKKMGWPLAPILLTATRIK